ncbi:phenylacetate--CoA ligase family protein [Pseudomonas sp. 6D_7.1_Bac1]|uniref:phenylacetate--CoA ligase family protein n=1 Tax=Pseudomonas sp. 6D_7.1_Bac1 TaxID=2971615 RepID=UPI0021C87575|nr:AMP-binding protein [Pseudomonas sp. 6D_7.1_Bac1]MCU1747860.1 AMP-binding protein [Pseudomonas sp. 6D_7.1_Bac1]
MNKSYSFEELLSHSRKHSRYYKTHFKHLPERHCTIDNLPLTVASDYWNGSNNLNTWSVLTGKTENALIYKTGGSTGQEKLVAYTRAEWQNMVTQFGHSLSGQLCDGDRVANLFFAGDLYASFLFIHDSLAHVTCAICEFPFAGEVDGATLAAAITEQQINVLAGVPAQLLQFAAYLAEQHHVLPQVTTVLYGGESLFAAQWSMLLEVFPNARVASIGYACVDAGLVGASTRDCELGEHRVFDEQTVVEIIDEHTHEVIEECNRPGLLIITNLTRTLMPLLRYPVGDRACWREPSAAPRRKFALLGRSEQSHRIRIGVMSLFQEEIGEILQRLADCWQWQLVLESVGIKDRISVMWVPEQGASSVNASTQAIYAALLAQYPDIRQMIGNDQLECVVSPCTVSTLQLHPRSGKQRRIVDLRVYSTPKRQPTP